MSTVLVGTACECRMMVLREAGNGQAPAWEGGAFCGEREGDVQISLRQSQMQAGSCQSSRPPCRVLETVKQPVEMRAAQRRHPHYIAILLLKDTPKVSRNASNARGPCAEGFFLRS